MKQSVIQYLHTLVAHNVIGDKQFTRRYNGFIGELDFNEWFRLNRKWEQLYNGGFLVPAVAGTSALDHPVYFTTSGEEPEVYRDIYRRIARLNCRALFFIRWDRSIPFSNWEKSRVGGIPGQLPVPRMACYRYRPEDDVFVPSSLAEMQHYFSDSPDELTDKVPHWVKARFSELLERFDEEAVVDLYVQRLIFDGYLGLKKVRGKPSDIDLLIKAKGTGRLLAFEVKEKDLSKKPPVGFGMDVPRMGFFADFMKATGIDVYYIVKQINNQTERKITAWRAIEMAGFIAHAESTVVEGGTGMRSDSSYNPTRICREKHFRTLIRYF